MNITLYNAKVKDVFDGFQDDGEDGVYAFHGKLTIRPAYQREFIYKIQEQEAVIQTVLKKFPLNTMYWVLTKGTVTKDENNNVIISDDAEFEVLDGQQRTLSVMNFLNHKLQITFNGKTYYNDSLPDDLYENLMEYEFMVYICEGTESEKLEWFEVVNVAGEELSDQELRNSVYTGAWLTDAKRHFSKTNCAAKGLSEKYISAAVNRQELLEAALIGICEYKGLKKIEDYMAAHKSDEDADELWKYFQKVFAWINQTFPDYNKFMKGRDWCHLYNKYSKNEYNATKLSVEVKKLLLDKEVQDKKGIWEYLLSRDEDPFAGKLLNLRTFDDDEKMIVYEKQGGKCKKCNKPFPFSEMAGDHIQPWSKGGQTVLENCQMLCKSCNSKKSDMY